MSEKESKSVLKTLAETSSSIIAIYSVSIILITGIITGYEAYKNISTAISVNTKNIEVTQMMILKSIVRKEEHNPCIVSDIEWDEYIENYTKLLELEKKYGKKGKNAPWQPMERVTVRNEECKKLY